MNEETMKIALGVWDSEANAISNLKNNVNSKDFLAAFELVLNCKGRIITAGMGTSGIVARKIAHSFCCVSKPAFYLSAGDGAHGGLGAIQAGDVVIAVSKGGNTGEIVKLLNTIKVRKIPLIGCTENENSVLGKASNVVIKTYVEKEACKYNMLATASIVALIAIFDAMAINLMEYPQFSKEQFYYNHPNGAVGEKLYHETQEK
ncbi:MAG TPA: phosphosugar isomerase [Firmicutes bacterium]|jgi:D-arabinose 5-phosphate isomerase GutQ|nr:phosphosugar isomerase [Bacillota bacterium]